MLLASTALCVLAACGGDGGEVAEPIDSRDGTTTTGDDSTGDADEGAGRGEGGEHDQDTDEGAGGDDQGDDPANPDGRLTISSSQDHGCDGEDVAVRGTDLRVGLSGACGQVTVGGNGNVVVIADATSVVVEGAGQDVDITGSTDAITLAGAGHRVAHTGTPAVDDGSAGSTVG
jgi:hypothetical protein